MAANIELSSAMVASQLQRETCDLLNNEPQLSAIWSWMSENQLDIDFQIQNAMQKQGIACVVMTPKMTLLGHDGVVNAYLFDELVLQIVENTNVNRPRLRKAGLSVGTALDLMQLASEILAGPQGGHFGEYSLKTIEQGEDGPLLVVKGIFQTTAQASLSGTISSDISGHYVIVPFVSRDEISAFEHDVYELSGKIIGFNTDLIKADIQLLSTDLSTTNIRITNLSDIYQPIGNYATVLMLAEYAKLSAIPTKTSDLYNDSNYLSTVSWSEITNKPAIVLSGEIPTKTSLLSNDSGFLNKTLTDELYINEDQLSNYYTKNQSDLKYQTIGNYLTAHQSLSDYVLTTTLANYAKLSAIPTKTSDLLNDSNFISSVSWSLIQNKPAVALTSQIPTDNIQLANGSHFATSSWVSENFMPNGSGPSLSGYATKTYVDNKVALESQARSQDMQAVDARFLQYAKLSAIPTKTSDLLNDSNFLTSHQSLADYITKTSADSLYQEKGNYLTAHQSLTAYATKQYVDDKTIGVSSVTKLMNSNGNRYVDAYGLTYQLSAHQRLSCHVWNFHNPYANEFSWPEFINRTTYWQVMFHEDGVGGILLSSLNLNDEAMFATSADAAEYIKTENNPLSVLYFKFDNTDLVSADLSAIYYDAYDWVNTKEYAVKTDIPTKTSQLQNDSGYLLSVYWQDIQQKPDLATKAELTALSAETKQDNNSLSANLQTKIDLKLALTAYQEAYITQGDYKIDALGRMQQLSTYQTSAYWEFSNGLHYDIISSATTQGGDWYAIASSETSSFISEQYWPDTPEGISSLARDIKPDTTTKSSLTFKHMGQTVLTAYPHQGGTTREWVTNDNIAGKNWVLDQVGDYYTKDEADAKFISAHQSLSNYYTKAETSSSVQITNALSSKTTLSYVDEKALLLSTALSGTWTLVSAVLSDDSSVTFEILIRQ